MRAGSRRRWVQALASAPLLASGLALPAWALNKPTGPVVLTLTGKIGERNGGDKADFDLAMLEKLPQQSIATSTPWGDQLARFSGPALKDVLAAAKASGAQIRAIAINDYKVTIPLEDMRRYNVIVALRMNDRPIPTRTKGPLWVIYPYDTAKSAADKKDIENRSIWQLRTIEVE